MKRSTLIKLLAPIISQKNTPVSVSAELIIKQLEELNLLKPTHKKTIVRRDLELIPYEDTITVDGWEKE
jgi:hypothetical protein